MEKKVVFSLSLLFFWVKGFISVDSRFVKVASANTILGFIPAGKDNQSIPLKNISSTRISTSYKINPIIIGIILIMIAFGILRESFFGSILILLIGIGILGSGILSVLIIQRAGSDFVVSVPFFDKANLVKAQSFIEEALAGDTDKTDLNLYFDQKKQSD